MKVKLAISLILLIIGTPLCIAEEWREAYGTMRDLQDVVRDPAVLLPANQDDPQPDTIFYDDGIGYWYLLGVTNQWADMRFTPLDSFELRSVYLKVANQNNLLGQASVIALQSLSNGFPSTLALSNPVLLPNPPPNDEWIDLNFEPPILIGAGEDFHICYGPAPGGQNGWFLLFDNSPCTPHRGYLAYNQFALPSNWITTSTGDFIMRAGGEYHSEYIDLENRNTFTDNGCYYVAPATNIQLKTTVKNNGNFNIIGFTIQWEVNDSLGNLVFRDEEDYGPLFAGDEASFEADQLWCPENIGAYFIISTLICPADTNPSDNISYLEQYVNTRENGAPFCYLNSPLTSSYTFDNLGVSFNVPEMVPAKLDSFKINFVQPTMAELAVYINDGLDGEPGSLIWEDTVNITSAGTYTFAPDSLILEYYLFTIYYAGSSPLLKEEGNFNASGNDSMMTVSWEYNGGWVKRYLGDWPFTVYVSDAVLTPPVLMIAEPDSENIVIPEGGGSFGWSLSVVNSDPQNSYPLRLWITVILPDSFEYLLSSVDFVISPCTYIIRPSLSQFIPWSAPAGNYLYNVFLANTITWQVWGQESWSFVKLSGEGEEYFTGGWRLWGLNDNEYIAEPLPATYKLLAIYPNPFNSETVITYFMPLAGEMSLVVYDIIGRVVMHLASGFQPAGEQRVIFDGSDLASGLYFVDFKTTKFRKIEKMMLTK